TYTFTHKYYTLSLHDALPILMGTTERYQSAARFEKFKRTQMDFFIAPQRVWHGGPIASERRRVEHDHVPARKQLLVRFRHGLRSDRKSTRLNSSHLGISYAVF